MEHKFNCLVYICTCNPSPRVDDEEQHNEEFFDILDGIDQFVEKGEADV